MPAPDAPALAHLRGECGDCFALCCVALPFAKSADFAVDKPGGTPCRNLRADYGCGIHADLRDRGFSGCTVFDCFGAGQKVSRTTFGGRSWRDSPEVAGPMFEVFPVMRQLHELLWYLTEALERPAARPLHEELRRALDGIERLTRLGPDELARVDVGARRAPVGELLSRTSELVRAAGVGGKRKNRRGADLMGARLRSADLRGASLRGAYLIGADLRDADLRFADVLGADFRDADVSGADLTDAVFLTRPQAAAARGDARTKLPARVGRPAHWAR